MAAATQTQPQKQPPFVKALASSDRKIRDSALSSLRTYLQSQRTLSHLSSLQLHRALFFAFYHADRALYQQSVATSIASLQSSLPASIAIPFQKGFWETMSREWPGIDRHRLDKYLLLVRRWVKATFSWLKGRGWDQGDAEEVVGVFEGTVLRAEDAKVPNGLRWHVGDVWADELAGVKGGDEEEAEKEKEVEKWCPVLPLLMRPWEKLAEESPYKLTRKKAKELLADERFELWGYTGPEAEEDAEKEEE